MFNPFRPYCKAPHSDGTLLTASSPRGTSLRCPVLGWCINYSHLAPYWYTYLLSG